MSVLLAVERSRERVPLHVRALRAGEEFVDLLEKADAPNGRWLVGIPSPASLLEDYPEFRCVRFGVDGISQVIGAHSALLKLALFQHAVILGVV